MWKMHKFLRDSIAGGQLDFASSSLLIRESLASPEPLMIGRFGSTEIKAVLYPRIPFPARLFFRERIFGNMRTLSGFFPSNEEMIRRFSSLMYEDIKQLDILGSWRLEEFFLRNELRKVTRVELKGLEPYLSEHPWTESLKGARVLVVHPFNKTIERQYSDSRNKLFRDERVLPEFSSFETVKAVQSIADSSSEFGSWFDALEYMKCEIDKRCFDVAILGCGAYGFPLAAHIKRTGRKAIHLGGATQILFGIKGRRWDGHPVVSGLYNDFWVRPSVDDKPQGAAKVENGCYW